MATDGKYCCFTCPKADFSEKALSQKCPECGRAYEFPLTEKPQLIGDYRILRSLGRGFYGATYVAEGTGLLKTRRVLKVVPKGVYEFFNKSFADECAAHAEAADGADFIVGIVEAFDAIVQFGNLALDCHVAVLEFIDGALLHSYVTGETKASAALTAQISADLLRIADEFAARKLNHNDFHDGNIIVQRLSEQKLRQGAMDPGHRVYAIDLGSISGDRRSGGQYKSDLHWIGAHIERLANLLPTNSAPASDLDSRVALELSMLAKSVSAAVENQRRPTSNELIKRIETSFFRTAEPWRPWREALSLREFGDSYNAQTLGAWHVPQLLVDPDREWQRAISSPGPLVVTGMRGCGKTMLLRALQFHARAVRQNAETDEAVVSRLLADKFAGFFVSAAAFLELKEGEKLATGNLLARLAIAYALEVSRSLAHLQDIDSSKVVGRAAGMINDGLLSILEGAPEVQSPDTIQQLERLLVDLLSKANRNDSTIRLAAHPSHAFPALAEQIRLTTPLWANAQVLFLLDDVSTRYVAPKMIQEILSALIFQNPSCAFKITSETQTLLLSLRSPGGLEHASHLRDFATFDLGAEVNKRLKMRGKKFLCDILDQRGKFFSNHPLQTPEVVLGDRSLADIASDIVESGPTSKTRKTVYHGIGALRAICVGDIGSVITIYENILKRAGDSLPASAQIQSDVLQELCSRQLYILDRRNGHLKSIAKSFAKASHELLMQSGKKHEKRGLRQYTSIYVRVTAGDQEKQSQLLRELVDAGVFVFHGGAPRTKTKDSDPIHQFKLTFRKIFGLADYIGLAERDRFELSGTELEEWLTNPANGAEILMRNLSVDEADNDDFEDNDGPAPLERPTKPPKRRKQKATQQELPLVRAAAGTESPIPQQSSSESLDLPVIEAFEPAASESSSCDLMILALGFEERAAESARRSLARFSPKHVIAVRYDVEGRATEILEDVRRSGATVQVVESAEIAHRLVEHDVSDVVIDVTGLTKAAIFSATREALTRHSTAVIAYTEAEEYYPLESSLREVLDAQTERDYPALLTSLKNVLTGEEGPYLLETLHTMVSDETRIRALLAHGSAKHERLIQLVQEREYDLIRVLVDSSESARATVARWAAEVAVGGALAGSEAGSIEDCNIRDPMDVIRKMERFYRSTYLEGGLNFEIGLTGDKLETIAAAAFCSALPVNRVWYVKPSVFDTNRFSKGTRNSRYFRIRR